MTTKVAKDLVDSSVLNRANHTGTQPISSVNGLQAALDAKADDADLPTLAIATWTPTLVGVANVDGTPTGDFRYQRIGQRVHCWGYIVIDPTAAAGAQTTVSGTLPIPSNLANSGDLRGVMSTTEAQRGGVVSGDVATDTARFAFASERTAATTFTFMFDYELKA